MTIAESESHTLSYNRGYQGSVATLRNRAVHSECGRAREGEIAIL